MGYQLSGRQVKNVNNVHQIAKGGRNKRFPGLFKRSPPPRLHDSTLGNHYYLHSQPLLPYPPYLNKSSCDNISEAFLRRSSPLNTFSWITREPVGSVATSTSSRSCLLVSKSSGSRGSSSSSSAVAILGEGGTRKTSLPGSKGNLAKKNSASRHETGRSAALVQSLYCYQSFRGLPEAAGRRPWQPFPWTHLCGLLPIASFRHLLKASKQAQRYVLIYGSLLVADAGLGSSTGSELSPPAGQS